jgi:hypothetical protein
MSLKEKKLFDVWKILRRFKYRVTNFFQYRLLATSKHMLLVGDKDHPLYDVVYKYFEQNWMIAHMGYFKEGDVMREKLSIDLSKISNAEGVIESSKVKEIEQKIKEFSKHYETILVLGNDIKS